MLKYDKNKNISHKLYLIDQARLTASFHVLVSEVQLDLLEMTIEIYDEIVLSFKNVSSHLFEVRIFLVVSAHSHFYLV